MKEYLNVMISKICFYRLEFESRNLKKEKKEIAAYEAHKKSQLNGDA